ncbi:MAG: hypothetical protein ACTSUV_07100 [Candidatus Ranarchaeia archaeon]
MGIIDFIKGLFSPKTKVKEIKLERSYEDKWLTFQTEYTQLLEERKQIRVDLDGLDLQVDRGEIDVKTRDTLYKKKLIRAARIIRRITEIKSSSAELGKPL